MAIMLALPSKLFTQALPLSDSAKMAMVHITGKSLSAAAVEFIKAGAQGKNQLAPLIAEKLSKGHDHHPIVLSSQNGTLVAAPPLLNREFSSLCDSIAISQTPNAFLGRSRNLVEVKKALLFPEGFGSAHEPGSPSGKAFLEQELIRSISDALQRQSNEEYAPRQILLLQLALLLRSHLVLNGGMSCGIPNGAAAALFVSSTYPCESDIFFYSKVAGQFGLPAAVLYVDAKKGGSRILSMSDAMALVQPSFATAPVLLEAARKALPQVRMPAHGGKMRAITSFEAAGVFIKSSYGYQSVPFFSKQVDGRYLSIFAVADGYSGRIVFLTQHGTAVAGSVGEKAENGAKPGGAGKKGK